MASKLEDRLQPGERVVYRTPRGWLPRGWGHGLIVAAFTLAWLVATGLIGFGPGGLVAIVLVLPCVALIVVGVVLDDRAVEAAVTERRVLRTGGRGKPEFLEVALEAVAAVEVLGNKVLVTTKDGETLAFHFLPQARALALALVRAAGLARLRLPRRRESAAGWVLIYGMLFGSLAAGFFPIVGLLAAMQAGTDIASVLLQLALFFGLLAAGFVGGGLLGLALFRPFFTRAEMADWLRRTDAFAPNPKVVADSEWQRRLLLGLLPLLYGRPPAMPQEGAERDGR